MAAVSAFLHLGAPRPYPAHYMDTAIQTYRDVCKYDWLSYYLEFCLPFIFKVNFGVTSWCAVAFRSKHFGVNIFTHSQCSCKLLFDSCYTDCQVMANLNTLLTFLCCTMLILFFSPDSISSLCPLQEHGAGWALCLTQCWDSQESGKVFRRCSSSH